MTMASPVRMVRDRRTRSDPSAARRGLGSADYRESRPDPVQNQVEDGRRIRPARGGSRITAAIAAFTEARRLLNSPKRLCLSARQEGQRSVISPGARTGL
jgi:hypothetical protein